ncbi:hypothetical protein DPMN_083505 [Dreissena polymorpha]|uniref:Uncharacterized protein n=1 Tax=Dreissena polymorpha TaxID=45954 RepID=A0A9D3Y8W7_DREPO|nr:hypothetical protein DPMN_083505 [Dreissena polymorpha]
MQIMAVDQTNHAPSSCTSGAVDVGEVIVNELIVKYSVNAGGSQESPADSCHVSVHS